MGSHAVYASPLTLNVSQPPFMPAQMTLTSTCAATSDSQVAQARLLPTVRLTTCQRMILSGPRTSMAVPLYPRITRGLPLYTRGVPAQVRGV